MKTELKFTFNEDDSEDKIHRLTNCDGAYSSLWDIQSYLRSQYKYGELPEEIQNYLSDLRDKMADILDENDIDLDKNEA